ncbi:hypothetical protein [Mucilaginibacter sp.]|uniref:hypothetical protein n=1 Tax=Mucilaginibacter sp. TaxID=1882438 RepID=UPI0026100EA6|nr:hypothetical protein [Mucilaginibacter sp.]MDB5031598.1 hypothetical protein [Mucilaginibacter sp.]
MKALFKYIIALLIIVACGYVACKKGQSSSTTYFNSPDLTKQIAVGFYSSLIGQYGGANINDGITAPGGINLTNKGPGISSVNSFCGYTIDTTYTYNQTAGDTVRKFITHYKFTYGCTANVLDSYSLADSITNTETGPLFANSSILTQNYFVKALDQTNKTASVEGSIGTSFHTSVLNTSHVVTQYNNIDTKYVLSGVKVDITSGTANITSGIATFTTQVRNLDPTTPFSGYSSVFTGTITFLSNHMAHVSISTGNQTKLYTVNLITAEVTAG